jgi:peptidyl-dipeptidase A
MRPARLYSLLTLLLLSSPLAAKTLAKPTVAEAEAFVAEAEAELLKLWIAQERAHWIKATHITHDTEIIAAQADEAVMAVIANKAAAARRFEGLELGPEVKRKLHLLKIANPLPAPRDAKLRAERARTATGMSSQYAKGTYCSERRGDRCLTLDQKQRVPGAPSPTPLTDAPSPTPLSVTDAPHHRRPASSRGPR